MRPALVALSVLLAGADRPPRWCVRGNPFGYPDVPDADGRDARDLAARVELPGGDADANAVQWVAAATAGTPGTLDGQWMNRWNGQGGNAPWNVGPGRTEVRQIGDRVYILADASNDKYLFDLKRERDRLIGRYQGVERATDGGPAVLRVVGDERIDGNWGGHGRWDFRRRLK